MVSFLFIWYFIWNFYFIVFYEFFWRDKKPYNFKEGHLWDDLSKYFQTEKYIPFFKLINELTPPELGTSPNACCGKGELLYRLLIPNSRASKKKGDIIIDNTLIMDGFNLAYRTID